LYEYFNLFKGNSGLSENSWNVIKGWKNDKVSETVRGEFSKIDKEWVWNIELLEMYCAITERTSTYIQYFLRSSAGDIVCPVKTRANQVAPDETDHVIMIVDGAIQLSHKREFVGKALFTLKSDVQYDFEGIDYHNLVWYNQVSSFKKEDAISCADTVYKSVCHQGWCGYNSFGQALKLGAVPADPNHAGKIVFKKLLDTGYTFDETIEEDIMDTDYLPSSLWLTSDRCKYFKSFIISVTNIYFRQYKGLHWCTKCLRL